MCNPNPNPSPNLFFSKTVGTTTTTQSLAMSTSNQGQKSLSLDEFLLLSDSQDQFIRGLMGSVASSSQRSNVLDQSLSNGMDTMESKKDIQNIINDLILFTNNNRNDVELSDDMSDSSVYEHIIDLVDKMLEDADNRLKELMPLQSSKFIQNSSLVSMSMAVDKDRLIQTHTTIDKPQTCFLFDIDNSRDRPFKPRLQIKPHAIIPLDIVEKSPSITMIGNNTDYLAPKSYYSHPYEFELKNLKFHDWQVIVYIFSSIYTNQI
jgi:hypothetical protein